MIYQQSKIVEEGKKVDLYNIKITVEDNKPTLVLKIINDNE